MPRKKLALPLLPYQSRQFGSRIHPMMEEPVPLNAYAAFPEIESDGFTGVRYKGPGLRKILPMTLSESDYDIDAEDVTPLFLESRKVMRSKSFKAFFEEPKKDKKGKSVEPKAQKPEKKSRKAARKAALALDPSDSDDSSSSSSSLSSSSSFESEDSSLDFDTDSDDPKGKKKRSSKKSTKSKSKAKLSKKDEKKLMKKWNKFKFVIDKENHLKGHDNWERWRDALALPLARVDYEEGMTLPKKADLIFAEQITATCKPEPLDVIRGMTKGTAMLETFKKFFGS